MPTNIITPLPPAPTRASPDDFNTKADAFVSALGPFGTELNLLATELEGYSTTAESSAASAIQTTNVTAWVSGTTYTIGKCVYDTTDFLTYRRKIAGAGTTRPGLDLTNWQLITGQGDVTESEVPFLVKTTLNATGNAPVYSCRAWVNFNGTGTLSIRASGNVSSITDDGIGEYTITFITALPNANYSIAGSARINDRNNSNGLHVMPKNTTGPYLDAFAAERVIIQVSEAGSGVAYDSDLCTVLIVG